MIKQPPSALRIAAMAVFSLSCFAILLFLWIGFGGSVPLRPEGYRVHVQFDEATQLAREAEVRISGVRVGRVSGKEADSRTGLTDAQLEIDSAYAPIPADARAILRQKTLLGETYVELTPGTRSGPAVPDGGRLPPAAVSPTVELDEIFRALDPRTRRSLSRWLAEQGTAVGNRGRELNDALALLDPFADNAGDVLAVLEREDRATQAFVRDAGEVFGALSERSGELRALVRNSNLVFTTTASRDEQLAGAVRALPTFLRETRATVRRATRFTRNADPLVAQLRPAARELSPALEHVRALAPDLRGLLTDVGPLVRESRRGLPAVERFLDHSEPLLARLDPYLGSLNSALRYLGLYRGEIAGFFANLTAATQATDVVPGRGSVRYARVGNPINPEVLTAYPARLSTSRSNPYPLPGANSGVGGGLPVFGGDLCGDRPPPTLSDAIPEELRETVRRFYFTDDPSGPPCEVQSPLGEATGGQPLGFPRLEPIR